MKKNPGFDGGILNKSQNNIINTRQDTCISQSNPESPGNPGRRVELILQSQSVICPIKKIVSFHYALVDDL